MFTKEDIQELLDDLEIDESMTINYEGFIGRGINGVSEVSVKIKNHYEDNDLVSYFDGYEEKVKTYLTGLKLTDRYIKVSFKKHSKNRYQKEFSNYFTRWSVVIPYDKINSIDIVKIKD